MTRLGFFAGCAVPRTQGIVYAVSRGNIAVLTGWDTKKMRKGATAVFLFTAPVLSADHVSSSLRLSVA